MQINRKRDQKKKNLPNCWTMDIMEEAFILQNSQIMPFGMRMKEDLTKLCYASYWLEIHFHAQNEWMVRD